MKLTNPEAIVLYLYLHGVQRAHVLRKVAYENTHGVGEKMPHRGWYSSYFDTGEGSGICARCDVWWERANGTIYDGQRNPKSGALWKLTKEGERVARLLTSEISEPSQGLVVGLDHESNSEVHQ